MWVPSPAFHAPPRPPRNPCRTRKDDLRAHCTRSGNRISLVYPVDKCVCGWTPQRAPFPDDPYCECSAANNQALFETVSGKPVSVKVLEPPRRGGVHCRFQISLT